MIFVLFQVTYENQNLFNFIIIRFFYVSMFSIQSLIFRLMFVLFEINYENQNLFQFHPHLIF